MPTGLGVVEREHCSCPEVFHLFVTQMTDDLEDGPRGIIGAPTHIIHVEDTHHRGQCLLESGETRDESCCIEFGAHQLLPARMRSIPEG